MVDTEPLCNIVIGVQLKIITCYKVFIKEEGFPVKIFQNIQATLLNQVLPASLNGYDNGASLYRSLNQLNDTGMVYKQGRS